jgi:phosphoglycerate dehydrogenase-like enzyme
MDSPRPVKVAILDDYQRVALALADWSRLKGADISVFEDTLADPEALARRLHPFEVICAMRERTRFPRDLLERLPNLKLIATTGMWNAAIDMHAAVDLGVTVCGTGASRHPTPELTWGLILALLRNIPAEAYSLRQGGWQIGVGGDLSGRTLGILGLGNIGAAVARVGQAFDMNIVAWSQNLTEEKAQPHGARLVDKDELFSIADIVTIHLVLSNRTRDLVGAHELGLMKPSSYLVNTSRGPIVTEAALVAALRGGAIAGAALDVFAEEPLPADHPFRSLPNVLATPHIGYVSIDTYRMFFAQTVENIAAWLAGSPIRTIGTTFRQYEYS